MCDSAEALTMAVGFLENTSARKTGTQADCQSPGHGNNSTLTGPWALQVSFLDGEKLAIQWEKPQW